MALFYDDFYDFLIIEKGEDIIFNGVANKALLINSSSAIDYEDSKEIVTNYPLKTGDLLQYQGSNWMVTGQVSKHQGFITYRSKIKKVEQSFKIIVDEALYTIPCILEPQNQSIATQYISTWSGNIKVLIQDNDITKKIIVDSEFIKMDAKWKITGFTTENQGLRTLYCEKIAINPAVDDLINQIADKNLLPTYSIAISNSNPLTMDITKTLQLNTIITKTIKGVSTIVTPNPNIIYNSSDSSISTVNNTGLVVFNRVGSVNLTASLASDNTVTATITVNIASIPVGDTYSTAITTTGDFNIRPGMVRTFYAKFYENGVEVLNSNISSITWTITDLDGISATNMASVKSQIDNKCVIIANDDISLRGYFLLKVCDNLGRYNKSEKIQLKKI